MSRFRIVLCLIAATLALWLAFVADKPWTVSLLDREGWRLEQIVGYYSFWAALGNLLLLGALVLTAGWWAAPKATIPPAAVERSPAWFWPLVLGAMIFCGAGAAMRMNYGFVHDEEYSARRVIAGPYKVGADGTVFPEKPKWRETLYYYRKPNNICFTAFWHGFAGQRGVPLDHLQAGI